MKEGGKKHLRKKTLKLFNEVDDEIENTLNLF